MELERWAELSAAISAVAAGFERHKRDRHSTALVVRVHTRAALHDRPVSWACRPKNWAPRARPRELPDQVDDEPPHAAGGLRGVPAAGGPADERRPQARAGEGRGRQAAGAAQPHHRPRRDLVAGRKPHERGVQAARGVVGEPHARRVRRHHAQRLREADGGPHDPAAVGLRPGRLSGCGLAGCGYLLGDAHYDASWLFDYCHHHGHQLVCPRAKPGTGLGHHYVSEHRRRAIEMLEPPASVNPFGPRLYDRRTDIERDFSALACSGGGLAALPPWVRRIWRVRAWVTAKLLINAARIRLNRKKAG